jgi:hypothetical protein
MWNDKQRYHECREHIACVRSALGRGKETQLWSDLRKRRQQMAVVETLFRLFHASCRSMECSCSSPFWFHDFQSQTTECDHLLNLVLLLPQGRVFPLTLAADPRTRWPASCHMVPSRIEQPSLPRLTETASDVPLPLLSNTQRELSEVARISRDGDRDGAWDSCSTRPRA